MKGKGSLFLMGVLIAAGVNAEDLALKPISAEKVQSGRSELSRLTEPAALNVDVLKALLSQQAPATSQVKQVIANKSEVVAELANHDVAMNVLVEESKGKLSYLTGLVSVENKRVILQRDYMAYKLVKVGDETEKVGVLLRIEAELIANVKNMDLGSLFAIGLAAKKSGNGGSLRVRVYGLSGEPITAGIPAPSDLSEASIQAAMESVAVIKASMFDPRVNVVPQVLPR